MAARTPKTRKEPETICVRIKRYNPKKGHKLQRFSIWGYKFLEEQNWYKVPAQITHMGNIVDVKEYLEQVLQDNEDPDSPLAFDVVTPAEAERINKREREAEQLKAYNLRRTGDPVDMTGRRSRSRRSESESGDLTVEDITYRPEKKTRRKFPRSVRPATREESLAED